MTKLEEFKEFAKLHPELINSIKDNSMTWQKFYELYDIYKDDENVWKPYLNKKEDNNHLNINEISNIVKNIDSSKIQKHLSTAQKALNFLGDITSKSNTSSVDVVKGPTTPRPINKFYGD